MAKKTVKKTPIRLLEDLDNQLYLLRVSLTGLESGEAAYSKTISTILRNLVCYVSGSEGLIWRFTESTGIDDQVKIQSPGLNINATHPRAEGLIFTQIPLYLAGDGPTELAVRDESLKKIIKNYDAYYVGGKGFSYEKLIQRIAGQIGVGHELDQADRIIADLEGYQLGSHNGLELMLILIAKLTLEVGMRAVEQLAEEFGIKLGERTVPQFAASTAGDEKLSGFELPDSRPPTEGTSYFRINHPHHDWRINEETYNFGSVEFGGLRFSTKKLPNRNMEIIVEGLDEKALNLCVPVPEPMIRQELTVVITWNNENIKVFLDTDVNNFNRVEIDKV
ncbi:hypothetical protein [Nitrospira sp. M1]